MKKQGKRISLSLCILLVLAALWLLLNSLVVTGPNEYKMITQFGSVVRVIRNPGPSLKVPFLQKTRSIPNYKMISDLVPSDVTTKDKKVMTVDSFVIWQISDPIKYWSSLNMSRENAEIRLGNIVYNSVKTVMSRTNQSEIISGRDGALADTIFENIGDATKAYGIDVLSVETKKLDLPESNKVSVYERMISERNNIAAGYTADGKYQSNLIRNDTDRQVAETIAKAAAEAEKIKAEGEALYMDQLSSVYNDPQKADFYNYVRGLDALKASLKGGDKTIILDAGSELARILNGTE